MKLLVLFLLFYSTVSFAAQNASVVTDGAMVYKKSNFDSAVMAYLRVGQKVRISSKKFGEFYRVQFKQGVIGYISDADVETKSKDKGAAALPTSKKSKSSTSSGSEGRARSFISKTHLGLSYSFVNYSEVFNQTDKSESLAFIGVKFTAPMRYLSGPFVFDSNLIYHSGYPSYYNMTSPVSQGISGRILLFDTQVLYSLAEAFKRKLWIYMGGGLALNYSSFEVEVVGSKQNLSDITFGGVLTGGVGYQLGRIAVKLEPKYYALKSNYFTILTSIQYEF